MRSDYFIVMRSVNVRNTFLGVYLSVVNSIVNLQDTGAGTRGYNYISECKFDNSWSSYVMVEGTPRISFRENEFLRSGGSSITSNDNISMSPAYYNNPTGYGNSGHPGTHKDENYAMFTNSSSDGFNPHIIFVNNNVFSNYVSGSEFYFKAFGLIPLASQIKSKIQAQAASHSRSLIKMERNPLTGLEVEKMNFIYSSLPDPGVAYRDLSQNNKLISSSEVTFTLDSRRYTIAPSTFANGQHDGIINNVLIWPLGLYLNSTSWSDLKTQNGGNAKVASDIAWNSTNAKYLLIVQPFYEDGFVGDLSYGSMIILLGFV